MPVRIIFRGLVLFSIENERGKNGRIVAQLVDCKHMMGGGKKPKSPHKDLHTHTPDDSDRTGRGWSVTAQPTTKRWLV